MPPCLCVGLTGHVPPGGHCAPLETRAGLSPWRPQDSAMACRARCLVRVSTHLLSDRARKVTLTRQVLSKAALFRGDHVIAQGDSSRAATHLKVRDRSGSGTLKPSSVPRDSLSGLPNSASFLSRIWRDSWVLLTPIYVNHDYEDSDSRI